MPREHRHNTGQFAVIDHRLHTSIVRWSLGAETPTSAGVTFARSRTSSRSFAAGSTRRAAATPTDECIVDARGLFDQAGCVATLADGGW